MRKKAPALSVSSRFGLVMVLPAAFVEYALRGRKPLFVFAPPLLLFEENTPAPDVSFMLPPRMDHGLVGVTKLALSEAAACGGLASPARGIIA